jgi:hypothetical protein
MCSMMRLSLTMAAPAKDVAGCDAVLSPTLHLLSQGFEVCYGGQRNLVLYTEYAEVPDGGTCER